MKSSRVLFFLSIVFFLPVSHAGVLLEPWLGYGIGKLDCTNVAGTDCSSDVTGVHYGARVGYKSMIGLWVAGEYNGSTDLKTEDSDPTDTDSDLQRTSLGVTVGFDLIFGLRVFAGYNFQEKIVAKGDTSDTTYDGGNSTKIGAGFKFPLLPLALNVEMNNATYKDFSTTNGGGSGKVADVFPTFKGSTLIFSVSAPLDF